MKLNELRPPRNSRKRKPVWVKVTAQEKAKQAVTA